MGYAVGDFRHPANRSNDTQREELKPGIDIATLVGAQSLDVAISVLGPHNRNRDRRRQCKTPAKQLLNQQATDSPVSIDEWMDHLEPGMSYRSVGNRSEISTRRESN